MSIALGAGVGADYIDQQDNRFNHISKGPFVVLRANAAKIKKLRDEAIDNDIDRRYLAKKTIGTNKRLKITLNFMALTVDTDKPPMPASNNLACQSH